MITADIRAQSTQYAVMHRKFNHFFDNINY